MYYIRHSAVNSKILRKSNQSLDCVTGNGNGFNLISSFLVFWIKYFRLKILCVFNCQIRYHSSWHHSFRLIFTIFHPACHIRVQHIYILNFMKYMSRSTRCTHCHSGFEIYLYMKNVKRATVITCNVKGFYVMQLLMDECNLKFALKKCIMLATCCDK